MLVVEIEPTGIKQVYLRSKGSEADEDLCLATWPVVRRHLKRLNKALQMSVNTALNPNQSHKGNRLNL